MNRFDYKLIADPGFFIGNCTKHHSFHVHYKNEKEEPKKKSSYYRSLNGSWKFHYAKNLKETIKGFESLDYSCDDWDNIKVPCNIELVGYGHAQYVNKQYPWEGKENIRPQECGSKCDVRYAHVKDKNGRDLCFMMSDEYMVFNALGYTPFELELADHRYELAKRNKTIVRIMKAQLGLGGDDSWGAIPHKEYWLDDKILKFKFSFKGIE